MSDPPDYRIPVNRNLVGLCAVLCLATAGGIWLSDPDAGPTENRWAAILAACVRVGLVMAALWFAMPSRKEFYVSPKVFLISFVALVGIVLRPRVAIPLLIVLAVLAFFLRPRNKSRKQNRPGGQADRRSTDRQPSDHKG